MGRRLPLSQSAMTFAADAARMSAHASARFCGLAERNLRHERPENPGPRWFADCRPFLRGGSPSEKDERCGARCTGDGNAAVLLRAFRGVACGTGLPCRDLR